MKKKKVDFVALYPGHSSLKWWIIWKLLYFLKEHLHNGMDTMTTWQILSKSLLLFVYRWADTMILGLHLLVWPRYHSLAQIYFTRENCRQDTVHLWKYQSLTAWRSKDKYWGKAINIFLVDICFIINNPRIHDYLKRRTSTNGIEHI